MIKTNTKKLGILGGSFDPPHLGHLKISLESRKRFKLNKIIWAITKKNPFKKKSALNLKSRVDLSKKIVKKYSFIKIQHFENKIKSNRTIDLINYLTKKNKNTSMYLIMGADNLINFHKWLKWKKISEKCQIIVFDRMGFKSSSLNSISYKKLSKNGLKFIKFNKVNISSSKLRNI